jgi:hypothetical protein
MPSTASTCCLAIRLPAHQTPAVPNDVDQQAHERAAEHAVDKRWRVPREVRKDPVQEFHVTALEEIGERQAADQQARLEVDLTQDKEYDVENQHE